MTTTDNSSPIRTVSGVISSLAMIGALLGSGSQANGPHTGSREFLHTGSAAVLVVGTGSAVVVEEVGVVVEGRPALVAVVVDEVVVVDDSALSSAPESTRA